MWMRSVYVSLKVSILEVGEEEEAYSIYIHSNTKDSFNSIWRHSLPPASRPQLQDKPHFLSCTIGVSLCSAHIPKYH